MHRFTIRQAPMASIFCLLAGQAAAGCNSSNKVYTCTGDVYPYQKNVDDGSDAYTFDFSGLSKNATNGSGNFALSVGSIGSEGKDKGDDGKEGAPITLSFSGGSYGISSSSAGAELRTSGGKGHDGKNRENVGNTSGGSGGDGGVSGQLFLNWNSGSLVSNQQGLIVQSIGGLGGDGGEGKSDAGNGHGDNGGAGGVSQGVSAWLGKEANFTMSSQPLTFGSIGGYGGKGGKGAAYAGEGKGAPGGAGGVAGTVSVDIEKDAVITSTGLSNYGAIFLYSTGGLGGRGGNASGTVGSSHAADGGAGGIGGAVSISTSSSGTLAISTEGSYNHALHVESWGGNGGDGGDGETDIGTKAAGGDGGKGGNGGTATVSITTASEGLKTTGTGSQGILARSYGGTGGDGGKGKGGLADGKGGSGAGPGNASTVEVTLDGIITTSGDESNAIIAQSVGGFAGDAGSSSGFIAYGAGAQSGGAGASAIVKTLSDSSITTSGSAAAGVLAQSVGGGGGHGSKGDGLVAMGGSGSSGGNAGAATLNLYGSIATSGETSAAAIASSVGGGGGSGGGSGGLVSMGGSAGSGGNGGTVTVTNRADLTTTNDQSDGVIAQSIGGGGGSAHSTSGMESIGGSGGSGGIGGAVNVLAKGGDVSTTGADSDAFFAQSIGGGGGSGSNAVAAGAQLTVAIGGSGGSGGNGGSVAFSDADATVDYTIKTTGDRARGILAQSVGGGGGDGGYAVSASAGYAFDVSLGMSGGGSKGGTAGAVSVDTIAGISTQGDHSTGVQAMSIGGGGGSSGTSVASANTNGVSVSQTVGGSGGSGGNGGTVGLTSTGSVQTAGAAASAINVQSVGGGGGYSGATISANAVSGASVSTAVGGKAGGGGNGAAVTVDVAGDVATTGDSATAISMQSIGGSGGSAHTVVAASGVSSTLASDVAVGGNGGGGGNGHTVTSTITGDVSTAGDNAIGISAQSIGGSGGNGSLTISGSLASSGDANVSVGGAGAASGTGGDIALSSSGAVTTAGDNALGIFAQSISNSGGHGGLAVDGSGTSYGNVGIGVGGSGGSGGTSGTVDVSVAGATATKGAYATGVKAMSVGGGGGSAIGAISGTLASMGEVGVTIGGDGATGGDAGDVSVTASNVITTVGDSSDGIYASSQGGSGGHGGFAMEGSLTLGEYSGSLNVNIGGAGGNGGTGGDVSVNNTATGVGEDTPSIDVAGHNSRGIFAQSVGGSGGDGGAVYSGNVSLSTTLAVNVGVDVGGGGGTGALGGDVSVTNAGLIQTQYINSDAILAQSIGGDGGTGGSSYNVSALATTDSSVNLQTVVGGAGGSGNRAGDVTVLNGPYVLVTEGDSSNAIYAQSVGGGGGRGGNAASILFDLNDLDSDDTTFSVNANINVGGQGGTGGHGGAVVVQNDAPIDTVGVASSAIYTQSIGGGGGDGGSVSGMVVSVNSTCTFSKLGFSCPNASGAKTTISPTLQLEIGGAGGAGGNGSTVDISSSGRVETDGDVATAIFAQSVGGGGGHGGYGNLGIDAWAPSDIVAEIDEYLKEASTPFNNLRGFQNVKVVVGGAGGSAGDASDVTVENTGSIQTYGTSSYGIHAQSVGGGGGHGGNALAGFGSITQLNVGGAGSGGGHGGKVDVSMTGSLHTYGDSSVGVFAQSVGGGGGSAGNIEASLSEHWEDLNIGMGVGIQLNGGGGGNGGDVTIDLETGSGIHSTGVNAHGIYAQSVGGTGGAAHLSGLFESDPVFSFNGSAGDVGKGGDIAITLDGGISVSGNGAHGVFAQSVSGTVATGDKSSAAGDITIDVTSNVSATGGNGRGMLLQSEGKDGHGKIAVSVASGATVSSSSIGYEAIGLMDGTGNTLLNAGSILRPEDEGGLKGYVIRADSGALSVTNSGTINGSVLLDASKTNVITNTGDIGLGSEFTIGSKSTLQNDGIVSAGTSGTVGASSVSGLLSQSAEGAIQVDFDYSDVIDTDLITVVSGPAPDLSGRVLPNGLTFLAQSGDTGSMTLLSSDVGIASNTLTVANSGTVTYALSEKSVAGSDQIALGFSVDYMAPAEDDNDRAFASYIDQLVAARQAELGSSDPQYAFVDDFTAFINGVPTEEGARTVYDGYAPGHVFMASQAALTASLNFSGALNSCDDPETASMTVFTQEGSCAHLTIASGRSTVDADTLTAGFSETRWAVTGGFQVEVAPEWFIGAALRYEYFDLTSSNGSSKGDGQRYHLGAVLKREIGPTKISASLSGGTGTLHLDRDVYTPNGKETFSSDPDTNWLAAHARISRITELSDRHFIRPWFDLGITRVEQDAFQEKDAGPHGLSVSEASSTFVTLNPGVETGSTFSSGKTNGVVKFRLGAIAFFGDDGFDANARMLGANGSGSTFNFSDNTSDLMADVSLAIDAQIGEKMYLKAGVQALLNNDYRDYSAGIRLSYAF